MLYLAMTAAEISKNENLPDHMAYMACHFSPYGTGLANLPQALPEGSMLIVNDRTPPMGHDPILVSEQLQMIAEVCSCSRILLDFQRPGDPVTESIVRAVLEKAPCPVGVSEVYAQASSHPVFLPPVPLQLTLAEYITPWQGRDIWLEAALDAISITVTDQGSSYAPCMPPLTALPHFDRELVCHYGTTLTADAAIFTLQRTYEDLQKLMADERIACSVGLHQELKGVP